MREQPAANHSAAHPQPAPDLPSLIEQTRSGDLDSFAELVRRFQHMAHAYAYSVLGDFHWAEDAAQEAFVEAYLHMTDLRHPEAFPGWLRRIVYKHCDRLQRKPRVSEVPLDEARDMPSGIRAGMQDPLQALQQQEMRERVMSAVRALPAPQREATMLFYINGYSQNEIAEFLEVPVTTVQKRLHDSRKKLKARMVDMVENTLKSTAPDEKFTDKVVEEAFEQLIRIKSPTPRTPMSLSPDGRLLAISVRDIQSRQSRLDSETQKTPEGVFGELIGSQVIIVDTKTGKNISPFPEGNTSWAGQWSPDGKYLAAYVQFEEPVCLGIYDRESNECNFLRHAPVNVSFGFYPPQWTPDGNSVLTTLAPQEEMEQTANKSTSESVTIRASNEGIKILSFDPSDTDKSEEEEMKARMAKKGMLVDLGIIDIFGRDVRRIRQNSSLSQWRLSPDGTKIAFFRISELHTNKAICLFDLIIYSLTEEKETIIARNINRGFGAMHWSPRGDLVAYFHVTPEGRTELYVVPPDASKEPARLSPEGEFLFAGQLELPKWSADGSYIYCMGWGNVIRYASDGNPENRRVFNDIGQWVQPYVSPVIWTTKGGSLVCQASDKETGKAGFAFLDIENGARKSFVEFDRRFCPNTRGTFAFEPSLLDQSFFMLAESSDGQSELWHLNNGHPKPKRVCSLNPKSQSLPKPEIRVFRYCSADGKESDAVIYLPAGHKEGKRYPLVAHVYGGQFGAVGKAGSIASHSLLFPGAVAQLTSRGFAVLDPDLPLPETDHMRNLPKVFIPAVQKAIDLGYVIPERIGLFGSSYGGYCVFSMLAQSSMFRAAVSCAGFLDLVSMYCSIMQPYIEQKNQPGIYGTLWDKRDAFIENSPLFYLDRVKTPLMIVSGTTDKYPAQQAEMAYYALKRLGQRVEMRVYEGEYHGPSNWSLPSLRDLNRRVMEWFDTYLAASE